MLVNITGSFVIGFFATATDPLGRFFVSPGFRQFFMIGVLGGYTTFSSFSLQTLDLAQAGEWWKALLNILSVRRMSSGGLARTRPRTYSVAKMNRDLHSPNGIEKVSVVHYRRRRISDAIARSFNCAPTVIACPKRCAVDPLWYKDAVIYELHVKTFHDSDGDGIGDFRGLIEKLDYLQELGVTAIWLLPFYPSPMRDDGYDIADYYDVNPNYGTLDDFQAFLAAAHERGLRVITELVINHTSDQNPWFQKSRRAAPGSPERELYVWSDTPEKYKEARIIFKDFETSNWSWDPVAKAYYWHRFYSHQPDLNFDNPGGPRSASRRCSISG